MGFTSRNLRRKYYDTARLTFLIPPSGLLDFFFLPDISEHSCIAESSVEANSLRIRRARSVLAGALATGRGTSISAANLKKGSAGDALTLHL